ncbi:MAG: hypothetical protein ACRC80_22255 [Waterburya sp.]
MALKTPVPTGVFEENPITGNLEEQFEELVLKATVKTVERSFRDNGYEVNPKRIYLQGYLVNPKSLPSHLQSGMSITAYLIDPHTRQIIDGEFIIDLTMQSRIKQVSKILGNQIKGWFQSV